MARPITPSATRCASRPSVPASRPKRTRFLKCRFRRPWFTGLGGEPILDSGGQTWMFYHAWNIVGGTRGDSRYMWLDRLDWRNGKPVLNGPTTDPQPAPKIGP